MNKFEKVLLTIFFIELFIGGGGRLIDFGFLSIRQVLFLLLIIVFCLRIIKERAIFNKEVNTFFRLNPITIGIYALIGWFIVSSVIGVANGHPLGAIVTDFFRVSFVVLYFPLAYYISKERFSLARIVTLLKYSALAVSIFTILVSLLGKTVFSSNFLPFYNFMNWIMNDDLYFRPSNSVFYKSHFFVLIGLIISLNDVLNKRYSRLDLAIIVLGAISILWSETRGFLLAFMLSVLMIIMFDAKMLIDPIKGLARKLQQIVQSKMFLKKLIISLAVMVSVPFLYKYMTLERFQTSEMNEVQSSHQKNHEAQNKEPEVNDVSVNSRMEFIMASKDILLHPTNFILGTGYGTEIAGRITGIEMSFLDILVEQGAIGLSIWVFLFALVYYNYHIAYMRGNKPTGLEVALLSVFMGTLLLTNINPFINNPIGISFFLVMLIISQKKKDAQPNGDLV